MHHCVELYHSSIKKSRLFFPCGLEFELFSLDGLLMLMHALQIRIRRAFEMSLRVGFRDSGRDCQFALE